MGNTNFGVAFDIGTTTIAGSLIDLASFEEIAAAALPNPQIRFGKDLLSRIKWIMEDASFLNDLKHDVIEACNRIIHSISGKFVDNIKIVTIAGNSVMEHILLGISPISLAKTPYLPLFKQSKLLLAKDIGLSVPPSTKLYTFPLIGGFIGGDTVAVILSTNIHKEKTTSLAIDIGTNSEIVLSSGGNLYAASAAAGPAFEGGHIENGMSAQKGAIQGVKIDNDRIIIDVIGKTSPTGICGTGVIEAVSEMLKADILDTSGRIKNRNEVYNNLANRVKNSGQKDNGQGNEFILYKDAKKEIAITQKDVRELQLAKGAIQAGIRLLMRRAKVKEIDKVYLAGAFGNNLKKESLVQIGILKEEWLNNVTFVGDAALDGAKLALYSEERQKEADEIATKTKYLSLSGSSHFQKEFIKGLMFSA